MELNIGAKIKSEARKKRISTVELAERIHMTRQNLDKIYRKKTVDTELLFLISKALDYDFFNYCSKKFKGKYLAGLDAAMTPAVNEPEEEYIANPLYDVLIECREKYVTLEEQYNKQARNADNQEKMIVLLEEKIARLLGQEKNGF